MNYQFTQKCINNSAEEIWQFFVNGLSNDVTIKSIKEKLHYTVNYINKEEISFSAATRNDGEPESIPHDDFIKVIQRLKNESHFNTSSAKELFKQTTIYKKRSPFFALLLSSGVIENT
ncbi:MAG: hypothetical protein ABI855_15960 [Bacteroidota bacterium]